MSNGVRNKYCVYFLLLKYHSIYLFFLCCSFVVSVIFNCIKHVMIIQLGMQNLSQFTFVSVLFFISLQKTLNRDLHGTGQRLVTKSSIGYITLLRPFKVNISNKELHLLVVRIIASIFVNFKIGLPAFQIKNQSIQTEPLMDFGYLWAVHSMYEQCKSIPYNN